VDGTREQGGHVPVLDGLRGLAILLVMISHETVMPVLTSLDRFFIHLTQFGRFGVDLFFVLSGYLITGILYASKGREHYFRNFYARRFLRIFPLYYVFLAVAILVLPHLGHLSWKDPDQTWFWFFLSNWSIGYQGLEHGILDVSWSLSVEEQFYVLWPLAVWTLSRRRLMKLCIGMIISAFVFRSVMMFGGYPYLWGIMFTPARMDPIAVGSLIALAARGPGGIQALVPKAQWVAIATGTILVLSFLPAGHLALLVQRDVGLSCIAALGGAMLIIAVGSPGSAIVRVLNCRFLRILGFYSYALYLFHTPFMGLVRDTFYGPDQFPSIGGSAIPGQLVFYVVAIIPALAGAWISWACFEGRLLALKKYFPSGPEAQRPCPTREYAPGADLMPSPQSPLLLLPEQS
jgi:peptidoglycan/LPS O-acetylase OafA/YrhL